MAGQSFDMAEWLRKYGVTVAGVPINPFTNWVQTTVTTKPVKPRRVPVSLLVTKQRRLPNGTSHGCYPPHRVPPSWLRARRVKERQQQDRRLRREVAA